jgi:hypothetical protein
VQTPGNGWPRLRWGGATPLLAFNAKTGVLDNLSAVQIERLSVVFDEGPDVGPDNAWPLSTTSTSMAGSSARARARSPATRTSSRRSTCTTAGLPSGRPAFR